MRTTIIIESKESWTKYAKEIKLILSIIQVAIKSPKTKNKEVKYKRNLTFENIKSYYLISPPD